jgi:hypothetical protein
MPQFFVFRTMSEHFILDFTIRLRIEMFHKPITMYATEKGGQE